MKKKSTTKSILTDVKLNLHTKNENTKASKETILFSISLIFMLLLIIPTNTGRYNRY